MSFLGGAVSSVHLDKLGHKVCPECLVEDGYGRDLWSLHYVLACPRHRVLLVHTCHECGQPFGLYRWVRLTGCTCGADLTQAPTVRADDHLVTAVAAIVRIASTSDDAVDGTDPAMLRALPEPLLAFTLDEVLDLFHVIGVAALAKPSRERVPLRRDGSVAKYLLNRREIPHTSVPDRLAIVGAAGRVVKDWPAAFWRVLDACKGRFPDSKAANPMKRDLGTVHKALVELALEDRKGRPMPLLWEALEEYRRDQNAGRSGATVRTTDPVANRLGRHFSVVSLGAASGLTYSLARQVSRRVIAGLETELRLASDLVLVAEFRRRYDLLAEHLKNSVTQTEMCAILVGEGIRPRFADWHAPDLLALDPVIQGFKRTTRYDAAVVHGLLARLRQGVQPVTNLDGLLRIASHAFMARFASSGYGRAEVLRDLLARRLPYYAAVPDPKYTDFHVDPMEATAILQKRYAMVRTLEARFVTWREAQALFVAAFGPDVRFSRAKSAELRRTGVVSWLHDKDKCFHDREQLFAWADAHLAPPGRSIGLFLDEAGLHMTERVLYHSQQYNRRRLCLPREARPRRK